MSRKRCIVQISRQQVTQAHRSLFHPGDPASLRCLAVLDGDVQGRIFTDCLSTPTWGMVQEAAFGCLY